jgi:hypothetical protein
MPISHERTKREFYPSHPKHKLRSNTKEIEKIVEPTLDIFHPISSTGNQTRTKNNVPPSHKKPDL